MSELSVVFEDFILSREALLCSSATIDFYRRMLMPFRTAANGAPPTKRMELLTREEVRRILRVCTKRNCC